MKQWYVLGADKACSNDENADGNVPVLCGALNPQQVMTIFTNVGYLLCVVSWFCTFCIRLARQSEWYNISISSFGCQCFIRCSLCPKAARWNVRNQRPTASRSAVLVILCNFSLQTNEPPMVYSTNRRFFPLWPVLSVAPKRRTTHLLAVFLSCKVLHLEEWLSDYEWST